VPEPTSARSVKIGADERTGWSSERPRRDGAPPRPPDISVGNRVLAPTDRLRYSPGSLVLVVGPPAAQLDRFADRVIEERGVVLSLARVRELLAGRVPEAEMDERAQALLTAAITKRLTAGHSVLVPLEGFDAAERERLLRLAHGHRRPRHLILLDVPPTDEDRPAQDALRRALDAGELGAEGFNTALRLGGNAITELKRIVFAPAPRD
jgi:hypothetical protein